MKYEKVVVELENVIIGGLQEFLMDSDAKSCCFNEYDNRKWLDCQCCLDIKMVGKDLNITHSINGVHQIAIDMELRRTHD